MTCISIIKALCPTLAITAALVSTGGVGGKGANPNPKPGCPVPRARAVSAGPLSLAVPGLRGTAWRDSVNRNPWHRLPPALRIGHFLGYLKPRAAGTGVQYSANSSGVKCGGREGCRSRGGPGSYRSIGSCKPVVRAIFGGRVRPCDAGAMPHRMRTQYGG